MTPTATVALIQVGIPAVINLMDMILTVADSEGVETVEVEKLREIRKQLRSLPDLPTEHEEPR